MSLATSRLWITQACCLSTLQLIWSYDNDEEMRMHFLRLKVTAGSVSLGFTRSHTFFLLITTPFRCSIVLFVSDTSYMLDQACYQFIINDDIKCHTMPKCLP